MQQPEEYLSQVWHSFNRLAALRDFSAIMTTMVLDMLVLHMNNKKVQDKLCTEHKETVQTLEIAIVFNEGVKRQRAYGKQNADVPKTSLKSEHVIAVEKTNPRESFRCGELNVTLEHVRNCKAANYKCKYCKIVDHMENCCNKK